MEQYFYTIDPKSGKKIIPVLYKDWEISALLSIVEEDGYIPYDLYTIAMAQILNIKEKQKHQN